MFDGKTYDPDQDADRLGSQLERVARALSTGRWMSLADIKDEIGVGSEAAISARIRDFRKPRFGGFDIERARVTAGPWKYRVAPADLSAFTKRWK